MNADVTTLFKRSFGYPPIHYVRAPGRLELLGNHTDYNQGLVMALAVDRYIHLGAGPRDDGRIELVTSAFPGKEAFSSLDLRKNPDAPWADYVKGVLDQFRKRGILVRGFNAAIHGTIPMGAGMSSSAAIEVATALMIRKLFPYSLDRSRRDEEAEHISRLSATEKIEIAKLCQAAENQFVGVQSGLLDQISSLFGKAFHAIEIDCQSLSVAYAPMVGEIAIIVCDSGVKHALVGGEYNELRAHCESAARKLGAKALRSIEVSYLEANKNKLTEREYQCAFHVVGEIQRVVYGARALDQDDFAQFGQYMFQSHESSRDFFKNSTAELDLLVELARQQPECFGARLTGGGFGGATINLVDRARAEIFMRAIADQYQQRTGRFIQPLRCQITDGAQ